MNFSVVVPLYNSSLAASPTLQCLLHNRLKDSYKVNLYIWNNGLDLLEEDDIAIYKNKCLEAGIHMVVLEDTRNIALSKIYNCVASNNNFDFLIIFDQDTHISASFLLNLEMHKQLDLILPIVYSQKGVSFPFYPREKIITQEESVNVNKVISISSGMAISKELVHIFKDSYTTLFDERFAFYGIDTTFFLNLRRVYQSNNHIKVGCYGSIKHSLAMDEDTWKEDNKRALEYLYFSILYRLHYKKKSRCSILYSLLIKILKGQLKGWRNITNAVRCVFVGAHPRALIKIDEQMDLDE